MPGAVLVGYAVMGLAARGVTVRGLRRAKFLRPLPPGVDFEVEANRTASGATIRWSADGQTVAQASASIDWPDG